jgi:hypothetical protein
MVVNSAVNWVWTWAVHLAVMKAEQKAYMLAAQKVERSAVRMGAPKAAQ